MDDLTKAYADTMMRAAVAYCSARGIPIDPEGLTAALKRQSHSIESALADARAALNCHMGAVADLTFRLSAANAGAAAARDYASARKAAA